MLYHIVLEGRRKPITENVITAHAYSVKPLYNLFRYRLEKFRRFQVQGSITLLKFKMSRMVAEYIEALANQFGGKNREIYGDANEFLRNDEIFPKFAAKFGSLRVTARHEAVQ